MSGSLFDRSTSASEIRVTVDMPMETSAQFVAVAAMFIDPDLTQNSWRLVLTRDELDPARPRIIEASQNQLTLHPFKEK